MAGFDFWVLKRLDALFKFVQFSSHGIAENFLAEINDT